MIRLRIFLVELLGMLDFSLLLKIWKHTCRFILIKDFTEMELEYINKKQCKHSMLEKMVYPTTTEELLAGTLFQSRQIHHVVNSSP